MAGKGSLEMFETRRMIRLCGTVEPQSGRCAIRGRKMNIWVRRPAERDPLSVCDAARSHGAGGNQSHALEIASL